MGFVVGNIREESSNGLSGTIRVNDHSMHVYRISYNCTLQYNQFIG